MDDISAQSGCWHENDCAGLSAGVLPLRLHRGVAYRDTGGVTIGCHPPELQTTLIWLSGASFLVLRSAMAEADRRRSTATGTAAAAVVVDGCASAVAWWEEEEEEGPRRR